MVLKRLVKSSKLTCSVFTWENWDPDMWRCWMRDKVNIWQSQGGACLIVLTPSRCHSLNEVYCYHNIKATFIGSWLCALSYAKLFILCLFLNTLKQGEIVISIWQIIKLDPRQILCHNEKDMKLKPSDPVSFHYST